MTERYLLVKHTEGWNVDRCCQWMDNNEKAFDWFYPFRGEDFPDPRHYSGAIIFGGAPSANDDDEHAWVRPELDFIEACLQHNIGFFGICLGAQMLARVLGSTISAHPQGLAEIGQCVIEPTKQSDGVLKDAMSVMQWHREGFYLPNGAVNIARSDVFENQAFRLNRRVYGVQFHPEVNPEALAIWHQRNRQKSPNQFNDEQRAAMMNTAVENDSVVTQWLGDFLTQWTRVSNG